MARLTSSDPGREPSKVWLAGVFDRAAETYDLTAGAYHGHFGTRLVELAGGRLQALVATGRR